MANLYIFDLNDQLLTILSNNGEGCPFWNAIFKEELNNQNTSSTSVKGSSFSFSVPADHTDSQYVEAENQVAFKDKDGDFRLFVIRETEDSDGEKGSQINATCEAAMLELNDEIVKDKQPADTTVDVALSDALAGTRWQPGTVASLGNYSTNFYYISATEAVQDILNTWGGELKDRITVDQTGITGRYIDILSRRGADTGKTWEMDKDIVSITRTVQSYPKTALYGRGASQETDNNGNKKKLTFANVVWSLANGDPADKPSGQEWIGDPTALKQYGRPNSDGSLRHRFGVFEDGEQKDANALLQDTWNALQAEKLPTENFKMDVFLLEDLSGYDHEKVRLGDTTFAIDRSFSKPIKIEERVISFEYDVSNPDGSGTVELGDFIDIFEDEKRLDRIESKLNNGSGIWNQVENPVTDSSFPDTTPPVPTNFTASGLFKMVQLSWDYDSSSYIAAYELYASQVQGFTPDSSNLVWRGKAGGYNFKADTDQQWYFQLRAINTHSTASDFTAEVSAQTVQIANKDIAPLTITNNLVADNADIDWGKIANVQVTNAQIANIDASKIKTGVLKAITIQGVTITGSEITTSGTKGTIDLQNDLVQSTYNLGDNANTQKISKLNAGELYLSYKDDVVGQTTATLSGNQLELFHPNPDSYNDIDALGMHWNQGSNGTEIYTDYKNIIYAVYGSGNKHMFNGGQVLTTDGLAVGQSDFSTRYMGTIAGDNDLVVNGQFAADGSGGSTIYKLGVGTDVPSSEGELSTKSTVISGGNLYVAGTDFKLGYGNTARGDTGSSRALVKYNNSELWINFGGDFSGGTRFNHDLIFLNQGGRIDNSGGVARWQQSHTNYIAQNTAGRILIYMSGNVKHAFNTDGTKSGGTIEVDGKNLGMSPTDSPQVLIEYIEFDVALTVEGTKVFLEPRYVKAVDHFAVFPNNGTITEKGDDYFIISGTGNSDVRIVGERAGLSDVFFGNLDNLET